ncbi:hypothetical protein V6N11_082890 [Hibiscus sabdariffa]|uniref:Uncharacterized protein n=1 Tax=Hibiscus sabdariffa TaxID=183260 RepID=A0ABR2QK87_9ROSI
MASSFPNVDAPKYLPNSIVARAPLKTSLLPCFRDEVQAHHLCLASTTPFFRSTVGTTCSTDKTKFRKKSLTEVTTSRFSIGSTGPCVGNTHRCTIPTSSLVIRSLDTRGVSTTRSSPGTPHSIAD